MSHVEPWLDPAGMKRIFKKLAASFAFVARAGGGWGDVGTRRNMSDATHDRRPHPAPVCDAALRPCRSMASGSTA